MDELPSPLTLFFQDDAVCCAHWHNLQVVVFVNAMQRHHLEVFVKSALALAQAYPGDVLVLSVILPPSHLSDASVMRRTQESIREVRPQVRHFAAVVELDDVWTPLIKAMLRSLALLSRAVSSFRLHDSIDAACADLAPRMYHTAGVSVTASELKAVVSLLRARLAPAPAARSPAPRWP